MRVPDRHAGGGGPPGIRPTPSALASRLVGRRARWRRALSPYYSQLLHLATAGRGIRYELNGEPFRIDPRYRVFLQPDYEAAVAALLKARVRPGQVCIDAGAHVGAYALQMARWTGPNGRVVAFEPNPGTAEALRGHVRMNHFEAVIAVEQAAVGRSEGSASLFGEHGSGLSRLGQPNPDAPGTAAQTVVPVVSLDAYCLAHAVEPDWLLVDVEGSEFDVIAGARATLARRGKALSIVMEVHPRLWRMTGWSRAEAEALLRDAGRRPRPLLGQSDPLGEHGPIVLEAL